LRWQKSSILCDELVKMNCINCGKKIAKARLKILPDTQTCVKCSRVEQVVGLTVWDKTTASMIPVPKKEAEEFWRFEKGDGRMGRLK
jgi:hypothetical protein